MGQQQERVLIGTSEGLHELGAQHRTHLAGSEMTALATAARHWWAIVDGQTIVHRDGDGSWNEVGAVPEPPATCLAPTAAGLLVGTAGAHLLRVEAGGLVRLDAFEKVEGREAWHTPWGDPPDTRSMAVDLSGAIYVNVHVGGVVRSTDGGRSWRPTLDIETDVHQILAHPAVPGRVFAASAVGLAMSADGGESWRILTDGLHRAWRPAGGHLSHPGRRPWRVRALPPGTPRVARGQRRHALPGRPGGDRGGRHRRRPGVRVPRQRRQLHAPDQGFANRPVRGTRLIR
jgi:hypothetical protein